MDRKNNCYNYAMKNMNNTYASPGGKFRSECKCQELVEDVLTDILPHGGRLLSGPEDSCPAPGWRICLFARPSDYHFYQETAPGIWTHKPGEESITIYDDDKNIIRDVLKAKKSYTEFCACFCVQQNTPINRAHKI